MGVVIDSPPIGLCQENMTGRSNWAGPVRIQIYYGQDVQALIQK